MIAKPIFTDELKFYQQILKSNLISNQVLRILFHCFLIKSWSRELQWMTLSGMQFKSSFSQDTFFKVCLIQCLEFLPILRHHFSTNKYKKQ